MARPLRKGNGQEMKEECESVEEGAESLLCLTNAMTSDLELDVRSFFIFVSAFMYTHLRPLLSHIDIQ